MNLVHSHYGRDISENEELGEVKKRMAFSTTEQEKIQYEKICMTNQRIFLFEVGRREGDQQR